MLYHFDYAVGGFISLEHIFEESKESCYETLESVIEQSKEDYYLTLRQIQGTIRAGSPNGQPRLVFFLRCLTEDAGQTSCDPAGP